nr:MAG TPA: hypothetical protein [Caudoviricetes sp.]
MRHQNRYRRTDLHKQHSQNYLRFLRKPKLMLVRATVLFTIMSLISCSG